MLRGGDPVQHRHLDVEDHQVRAQLLGEVDGLLAVAGLADDLVALLGQHLGEVHADECLVLGDDDAAYGGSGGAVGLRHGRKASPLPFGGRSPGTPTAERWSQTPSSVSSNLTRGTTSLSVAGATVGVMYDAPARRAALEMVAAGLSLSEIARATGIHRSTVRAWVARPDAVSLECFRCSHLHPADGRSDAALLGYYLGDGCVSIFRGRTTMRISCDAALPGIIADATRLMLAARAPGGVFLLTARRVPPGRRDQRGRR